jgi:hemerythrin-like domain-containing protein
MKATALLKKQHRDVKAMFKKLESGREDREPLLRELADSLAAHMAIEQTIFYPAIRSLKLKEDLISESFEEHAVAELALKRLLAIAPDDDSFKAKVTTLKELIEHHVEEEEEELFPAVEKKLAAADLEALGKDMKQAFDDALGGGFDALVPRSMASTSADAANRRPGVAKSAKQRKDGHAFPANASR